MTLFWSKVRKSHKKHTLWSTRGHRSIILCSYSCYSYTDTQYHSKRYCLYILKEQRLPNIVILVKIKDFPISLYKINANFRVTISIKDLTNQCEFKLIKICVCERVYTGEILHYVFIFLLCPWELA